MVNPNGQNRPWIRNKLCKNDIYAFQHAIIPLPPPPPEIGLPSFWYMSWRIMLSEVACLFFIIYGVIPKTFLLQKKKVIFFLRKDLSDECAPAWHIRRQQVGPVPRGSDLESINKWAHMAVSKVRQERDGLKLNQRVGKSCPRQIVFWNEKSYMPCWANLRLWGLKWTVMIAVGACGPFSGAGLKPLLAFGWPMSNIINPNFDFDQRKRS